jgi:hypothetical protein
MIHVPNFSRYLLHRNNNNTRTYICNTLNNMFKQKCNSIVRMMHSIHKSAFIPQQQQQFRTMASHSSIHQRKQAFERIMKLDNLQDRVEKQVKRSCAKQLHHKKQIPHNQQTQTNTTPVSQH